MVGYAKNEAFELIFGNLLIGLGGFLAGSINTLAGNGSAITLSILTELLGLPGNTANGTNRVGVLFQSMAASISFHRHRKIPYKKAGIVIWVATLGAIIGVIIAALVFAWENSKRIRARKHIDNNGIKHYEIYGPLFFASVKKWKA